MSVPPARRLHVQGLRDGRRQGLLTIAGMVAVLTAVLAGSSVAIGAAVVFHHSLVPAFVVGAAVALATLAVLLRHETAAWRRADLTP